MILAGQKVSGSFSFNLANEITNHKLEKVSGFADFHIPKNLG
ncbi:hypothetical protein BH11PAT4_BH11PAT4_0680 [soil metagenome]